jgi:hypothetical protein
MYNVVSFQAVGSQGPSFMGIEDIEPNKVYNLVGPYYLGHA